MTLSACAMSALVHILRGRTLEGRPTAVGRLPTGRGGVVAGGGGAGSEGAWSSSGICLPRTACLGWTLSAKRIVGVRVAFASRISLRRCAALDIVAADSASPPLLVYGARGLLLGAGEVTRLGTVGRDRSADLEAGARSAGDSFEVESSKPRGRMPRSRSSNNHSGRSDG